MEYMIYGKVDYDLSHVVTEEDAKAHPGLQVGKKTKPQCTKISRKVVAWDQDEAVSKTISYYEKKYTGKHRLLVYENAVCTIDRVYARVI